MSSLGDTVSALRRVIAIDADVQALKLWADSADERISDQDRRLVRIETVVQMLTGVNLPPITPLRLPRR